VEPSGAPMRTVPHVKKGIRRGRQIVVSNKVSEPIPVAARSKACVCGYWHAGIPGSNSAGDMDVCILWVLCVSA
jgi:hypothetical protein